MEMDNRQTAIVKDNRKKVIFACLVVICSVMLLIAYTAYSKHQEGVIPNIISKNVVKAEESLSNAKISLKNVSYVNYEESKALDECDSINMSAEDPAEFIVLASKPEAGTKIKIKVDPIIVAVINANEIAQSQIGNTAEDAISFSKSYGIGYSFYNNQNYYNNDEVVKNPSSWVIYEAEYDIYSEKFSFGVTSAEYEKSIEKDQKAENQMKNDLNTLEELVGKPLSKALDATKTMDFDVRYVGMTYNANNQWISMLGEEPKDSDYEWGDERDYFNDENGYTKDVLDKELWITDVNKLDNDKIIIRYAEMESAVRAFVVKNQQ